jgi:aldehyde dehydrogenase (NAD+)
MNRDDTIHSIFADVGVALPAGDAAGLLVRTPVDGRVLARLPTHTPGDVSAAIERARSRFAAWRDVPAPRRGELIRAFGEAVRRHKPGLAEIITLEAGKITQEGLGEVQEVIDICEFAVGLSRQLYGLTIASERPDHKLLETWHPLGVVGVISAFNFPMAVFAWNASLALVTGNTLVWKPSEKTPLSGAGAQRRAAAVRARPRARGRRALRSADRRSHDGRADGQASGGQAGQRDRLDRDGTPGGARLRIDLQALAARARRQQRGDRRAFGRHRAGGSRRNVRGGGHGRTALHDAAAADRASLRLSAGGRRPGPRVRTAEDRRSVGRWHARRPADRRARLRVDAAALARAREMGATVHFGAREESGAPDAYYVRPAIVEMQAQAGPMLEETFAPILYVTPYDDFDDAIAQNNAAAHGLSSSVFTRDLREAELFTSARGSDCGIANVNIGTSGAEIGGAFGG